MARTDAHRPSAINPSEYRFVAMQYIGPSAEGHLSVTGYRKVMEAHMAKTGGRYSGHDHGGTCHVCGALALYLAIYHHEPTNVYIKVGEDCADKMEFDEHGDAFRSLRKSVTKQRSRAKMLANAKAEIERLGLSDAWVYYEYGFDDNWKCEEPIIQNIIAKLVQYGNISEKQVDLYCPAD